MVTKYIPFQKQLATGLLMKLTLEGLVTLWPDFSTERWINLNSTTVKAGRAQ